MLGLTDTTVSMIMDGHTRRIFEAIVPDDSTLRTLFQVDKSITQEGAHE